MQRFDRAGYAGSLAATRNPALSDRFQFWRGGSGRRYAVSVYPPDEQPPYDLAVSLYIRLGADGPEVLGISAGLIGEQAPEGTDEVHVHVVERIEALAFAHRDLRALLETRSLPAPKEEKVIRFYPRHAA